ncbi:MAG: transglycosylase SLT domain-containing protein [Candidatus Vogelbacteria bacterium]|nr:transglycosylase SLT domain-containing protein [Candidatus Vogelbacteria bacterium]
MNLLVTPQWSSQNDKFNISSESAQVVVSACDTDSKSKDCVVELIKKYAEQYGVRVDLAISIADCESDFKVNARGDSGKAYGIYQFHKPTFDMFSKKLGEKLDYFSTEDNIKLAMWAMANDKGFHWSCYRKIASR